MKIITIVGANPQFINAVAVSFLIQKTIKREWFLTNKIEPVLQLTPTKVMKCSKIKRVCCKTHLPLLYGIIILKKLTAA